jgi:hypothetical protein
VGFLSPIACSADWRQSDSVRLVHTAVLPDNSHITVRLYATEPQYGVEPAHACAIDFSPLFRRLHSLCLDLSTFFGPNHHLVNQQFSHLSRISTLRRLSYGGGTYRFLSALPQIEDLDMFIPELEYEADSRDPPDDGSSPFINEPFLFRSCANLRSLTLSWLSGSDAVQELLNLANLEILRFDNDVMYHFNVYQEVLDVILNNIASLSNLKQLAMPRNFASITNYQRVFDQLSQLKRLEALSVPFGFRHQLANRPHPPVTPLVYIPSLRSVTIQVFGCDKSSRKRGEFDSYQVFSSTLNIAAIADWLQQNPQIRVLEWTHVINPKVWLSQLDASPRLFSSLPALKQFIADERFFSKHPHLLSAYRELFDFHGYPLYPDSFQRFSLL